MDCVGFDFGGFGFAQIGVGFGFAQIGVGLLRSAWILGLGCGIR